jgi:uncharacterized protein (DUF934 family)
MEKVKEKLRTVTFLTREQVDYLDKMGKDALFYQGRKLSRAEILSELVDFLMHSGIDIKKLDFKNEQKPIEEVLEKINTWYQNGKGEKDAPKIMR